jgi:CheY-like chemotaxis protein
MASTRPSAPVLIVDDSAEARDDFGALLESDGYRVVAASDGREALGLLRRLRSDGIMPCLILLDLTMPRMSGWDFRAEQTRDETLAPIPVVVLSADPLAMLAKNSGAAAVLQKPADPDALLAAVELHCAKDGAGVRPTA